MLLFSFGLMYQCLNGAIPSRKCSITASAKWRNSVYVMMEICHKRSTKWLGPKWHWYFRYTPYYISKLYALLKRKSKFNFEFWWFGINFNSLIAGPTNPRASDVSPISAKFHGVKSTCQSWIVNWFWKLWWAKTKNWNPHNNPKLLLAVCCVYVL